MTERRKRARMYQDSRVAQMVERPVVTREVGGSMPSPGARVCGRAAKATACKAVARSGFAGSSPAAPTA